MNRCRQNQLVRLVVRDGDRCHWCHHRFDQAHPVTFEHLTPRLYGGTHDDSNVVLACGPCNTSRGHRVFCTSCGHRIRRGGTWIDRRRPYHLNCLTRTGESQKAPDRAQPDGNEQAAA